KTENIPLPQITLNNGTVIITDRQNRTATIQPFDLRGKLEGELVYRYDATAGPPDHPQLHLLGKLAPGGAWEHEVAVTLADLGPWLHPFIANPNALAAASRLHLDANWRGSRKDDGSLTGLLEL